MLDVFRSDAFSVVSLTDAINKVPHRPGRIGQLGLFRSSGITSTTVVVEAKDGRLELIATTPRGGVPTSLGPAKRTSRAFVVPHLEKYSTIYADQVQGVRPFGEETGTDSVQAIVNERLTELRSFHDVTLEYHRMGALRGNIYDADGVTVLFNLFTEFGVSQQTHDINLGTDDVQAQTIAIQRKIEDELGNDMVTGFHAFAGDAFYDALRSDPNVRDTLKALQAEELRENARVFRYGGITWENYRGRVGGIDFVPTDEAIVFPLGTGIFRTYFAPADYMETVNTVGLPLYSKIFSDPELNRWVKVHTQSNPLNINLRPRAVIRVTKS